MEFEEFHILAALVQNIIPYIGLRNKFLKSKKAVVYACDTERCPQVNLWQTERMCLSPGLPGHSSAEKAGKTAALAEAGALYFIHYPKGGSPWVTFSPRSGSILMTR